MDEITANLFGTYTTKPLVCCLAAEVRSPTTTESKGASVPYAAFTVRHIAQCVPPAGLVAVRLWDEFEVAGWQGVDNFGCGGIGQVDAHRGHEGFRVDRLAVDPDLEMQVVSS